MKRSVFLAYPLTTTHELELLELFVNQLRIRLSEEDITVQPKSGGPERIASSSLGATDQNLLASNVDKIASSDVFVLLLPSIQEPSSVWMELGIAIAARRAIVIVGPSDAPMPFLGRLALQVGGLGGNEIRGAARVISEVIPKADADDVFRHVLKAIRSFEP